MYCQQVPFIFVSLSHGIIFLKQKPVFKTNVMVPWIKMELSKNQRPAEDVVRALDSLVDEKP
jgi:hypothetical protein